jgi:hypothetical protein
MAASRTVPITQLCSDINLGKYDRNDGLAKIIKAMEKRIAQGRLRSIWTIDCLGVKATEDDLLVDEAWQIEQATDLDWKEIDPIRSATHFRAILTVLMRTRLNMDPETITAKIAGLTVLQAAEGIDRVPVPGDDDEGGVPLASDV